MTDLPNWLAGTTHKDWLRDGRPCNAERWAELDWSKAYMDLGPSVAGNSGPYWHVMDKDGACSHRLYPNLLKTKWLHVVRHAIEEAVERERSRILSQLPGGQICDPQEIADMIRGEGARRVVPNDH